jgi:hypothetical protein
VLCGKNWERLENLYDALIGAADPSKVRPPHLALVILAHPWFPLIVKEQLLG